MRLKLTRRHELKLRTSTRLPAQIIGGAGVEVTRTNGAYTIAMEESEILDIIGPAVLDRSNHTGTQLASTISDFSEATDDRVSSLLTAGDAISLTYNDASNTLTVANTGVRSIAGNTGVFTLGNGIGNSTNQIQLTAARRTLPTTQVFTSGSGTYTTPANVLWIEVELIGGGGGGAGSGTSPGAGGAGGATTWGTGPLLSSGTAGGAVGATRGAGGIPSGGYVNRTGADGGVGSGLTNQWGGAGAGSAYGGGGYPGNPNLSAGGAAPANSGAGGGGGGDGGTVNSGGGGGAGGFVRAIFNSPNATYSYAVGAGGAGGTAGTSGVAGGAGGSGMIIVIEHYGS